MSGAFYLFLSRRASTNFSYRADFSSTRLLPAERALRALRLTAPREPNYNGTIMKSLLLASVFLSPLAFVPVASAEPSACAAESVTTSVALPVGAVHTLLLNGNPTTGFTWNVASQSSDAVRVETEVMRPTKEKAQKILCGSPSPTQVTITAEKPGEAIIVLEYKRVWETGTPAAKTIICKVTVAAE